MRVAGEIAPLVLIAADVALLGLAVAIAPLAVTAMVRGMRRRGEEEPGLPVRRCMRCGRAWEAVPGTRSSRAGAWVRRALRRRLRSKWRDPPAWTAGTWNRCPNCLSGRVRSSRLSDPAFDDLLVEQAAADRAATTGVSRLGVTALVLGALLIVVGIAAALL
jgi:hypothetical protein